MSRLLLFQNVNCSTLVELLRTQTAERPRQQVFRFLADGENESSSLTFSELDCRARAIGAHLQQHGLRGGRALLLFPSGLDFIAAFFGCLYAAVVAVPAYPPGSNRGLSRLIPIVNDAKPVVILTNSSLIRRFNRGPVQALNVPWINVDEIDQSLAEQWQDPEVTGDALAFLQYTSGSTASPKGVMISHQNVLNNERLIQKAFNQTDKSVIVGWLPFYHDMGLIGNILQPIYSGSRCVLMPPQAFLQKPLRWLKCISCYGATTSGGPNFAYQLCVDKITPEERQGLTLDSWKVAFNGAEPVRHETLRRFSEAFEQCGFRASSLYPCYGLAEATLLVASRDNSHDLVSSEKALISSGVAVEPDSVILVDPKTFRQTAPNETGEIWLKSSSVAQGYWNRPKETEQIFRAYLSGGTDGSSGPFLRTGDLGFFDNGNLFITGRLKDLIIIRGRNFYPQDVESAVERSHPALGVGVGAAFSVDGPDGERLVVTQEIGSNAAPNIESISVAARRAVAEEHEVHIDEIVYVRAGTLPRTTSGKTQRHLCRTKYLDKALKSIGSSRVMGVPAALNISDLSRESLTVLSPPDQLGALQSHIRALVARVLKTSPDLLDSEQPLLSLGLDSLMTVELQHRLEEQLDVKLPLTAEAGGWSITSLAEEARNQLLLPSPVTQSTQALTSEYPLSYGQEALWFLHKLAPDAGAYNLAAAVRIDGQLKIEALKKAFQTLTDRHPVLRTNFRARDGQPVQWVHADREVCFEDLEASEWDEVFLKDRLADEANRPFDLEADSLLRVKLFKESRNSSVLLLVVHHIVADFYSLEILIRELTTLYRHYQKDQQVALEPLPQNYSDYVRWQSEMLSSSEGSEGLKYWREQLSGELPVLNLPTNRVRPAVQTYRGAATELIVEPDLTEQLKSLGRSQDVTLYTLLLSAFQVLLHRYTGQDDLIVGTPTTGRVSHEFDGLMGYFVNPLPMRADLAGNPTFAQLLKRAGQSVLEAIKHQSYPFPLLVEQLECARDPSRSPLFQVMFVLQKTTRPELEQFAGLAIGMSGARMQLGELALESVELDQRTSQFDLTLLAAEHEGRLSLRLQYNTDLFDKPMAVRLLRHYGNILQAVAANPDQRIRELPLLSAVERNQLVLDFNDTASTFPAHQCIHELFEAQAERTPDAVALLFEDQSVSYRELNNRANRVASRLRACSIGPEDRVAIRMDRCVEIVAAMLGVLKAGAAYVPIEPDYPRERIAFMFENAGVSALLTQDKHRHLLHPDERVRVLYVEDDVEPDLVEPNQGSHVLGENLAYIIYTSGSTGQPKGVAITHRSAVAFLHWARDVFSNEDLKRVLASTSVCFDLSIFELFVPLSWGGAVVLVRNLLEVSTLKNSRELTLINTVPSVLAELQRDGRFPSPVRTVNLAGEALSPGLVDETYQKMCAGRVLNLYGPSEDTTYSCYAKVGEGTGTAPIGKPIANTQANVLDELLQPVPKGVVGELYLGGAGLARGYFARPDLTAERFIPNPFDSAGGTRLYRTGDLARYLENGQLEFLGRADHQVKIHGFRIELGEIETVLRGHPGVFEAVTIAREDTPGDRRLVAYTVPKEGYEHSVAELRSHLRERLPAYMVPTAFVLLEALPLTPNGKVNRGALPAPEARSSSKANVTPATATEKKLADIWTELLNIEHVSVNDDFFEMGGHSLLAARLTSRVWQAFDVELSLRSVFTTPTISGLAALIEASSNGGSAPPITRITRDQEQYVEAVERDLPALHRVLLRPTGAYTAPRTPIEEVLAEIWTEFLNVNRVSVHDDFFEAGGHSLLATRLASRIRQAFHVEVSLRSVFESPTIALLAQLIKASPPLEEDVVPEVPDGRLFPLSYSQQRLWFLHSLEPERPAYNLPGAIRLSGQLEIDVLHRCLNEILRRHEILRTRFIVVDGQPHQLIESDSTLKIGLVDLSALSTEEREAEMKRLISAEARLPFDLAECPLVRATVLRFANDERVLLLTLHHIIADGWSLGVLAREVGALYRAFLGADQSPLAELAVQYVDFAAWQQKWLTTGVLQGHLDYWKDQLAGSPGLLDLPTDRPRPLIQTFRGATRTFELTAGLTRRLNDLSRSEDVTLFMTLLAAFKVLLAQYTRQFDLSIGTPIANRNRLEIEGLIGCFVNTLVLRTELSGNPGFRELLRRVRKVTLEAFDHQDLPFEKLVEELQPERRLSQSPLFQVMFVLQEAPAESLELTGLRLESLEVDSGTAKYDLTLSISQTNSAEGGLLARLEYNTDLFDDATAVRLLAHYNNILEAVADNPGRPIFEVPLLTSDERRQLLFEWNDTEVQRSPPEVFHQLIEAQAKTQPDAVAVVFEGKTLTYAELNQRANQLAHHLRRLGIGPETFVGICIERSMGMVWGLLGILKAGGAYVPIDPSYPPERLSYMLEDSGVSLLLTQRTLASVAATSARSMNVLFLDDDAAFDSESSENPPCALNPDNAAYAIYTSGSTGQPKAAINTHRAITNRLLWMQDAYHLTKGDCVLQKTPFSFDVSVWEFFWPLLVGARLVLARPGGHLDSNYLVELIRDQKVTTVHFVPSMLEIFLQDPDVRRCESLRQVICSGEALSLTLMQRFFENVGAQLHNLYGPTEAAVDVTSLTCDPSRSLNTVPIGRPIANTQIYILNPELQPVPVGVYGELHIGGVSLARGYLDRPALTAQKFIPDPYGKHPGARLYKTGDVCRYLADGTIEFLGRIDHQVKLRGFRIELGEIEAALRAHPLVRDAVASVQEDSHDEKRLVAYLVIENGSAPAPVDFRQFLKERLPDYMLPSALFVLDKLPLTSSGKADRKALPKIDRELIEPQESYVPPSTLTEKTLAEIWRSVLGLERVGINDNFFEIGGDSILSMRVVIDARKSGIELRPKDIFAHQTIAELAAFADSHKGRQAALQKRHDPTINLVNHREVNALLADGEPVEDVYPLTPVQEGMLFHSAYSPESELYFEQMSLTLTGEINSAAFRQAWQELINRHAILRSAFVWENVNEPLQVVRTEAQLPWEEFDWRGISGPEQQGKLKGLLKTDRARGFDSSVAPLMRVSLARLADQNYALVWSHHHMLLDGWSQPLLLKEFVGIYEALSNNGPAPPNETAPFRNYLAWLQQQDLALAEVYWRETLKDFDAPTALAAIPKPAKFPGQDVAHEPQRLLLTPTLTNSLMTFAREHYLTLSTLVQGAWALLLGHYSGEDDVVFGVTVSGRPTDLAGAQSMVGMFINTLPLRVPLPWDSELLPWLRQIQTQQSELIEYAYSPLAKVQRWSDVRPCTPLFESIVVFQNYPIEQSLENVNGLFEISNVRAYERTKYPLMLVVEPGVDLSLRLLYEDARFDSFLAARVLKHLQNLLEGIASETNQNLANVPLLTTTERDQILRDGQGAQAAFPQQCVHEMFEAQVRKTPDVVALTFGEENITYRELDTRANQLAHYLRSVGIGSQSPVGLCVERSTDMVTALLAIFKAGGVFVPLNPQYPSRQRAYMMNDAQVQVLIAHRATSEVAPAGTVQVVNLDDCRDAIANCSSQTPQNDVQPDHLAYVIYTSGSTGQPKGVLVEHRNFANTLLSSLSSFQFRSDDVMACVSAFSFDIFLFELFCPLLSGGRCLLVANENLTDAALVRDALRDVTVIHAVPTLMRQLVAFVKEDGMTKATRRIRQVFVGGDAVPPELLEEIQEVFPLARIDVLYGPTEATIICAHHTVERMTGTSQQMIGKPMHNVVLRLCDNRGNLVPVGVKGEIYIGGAGVTRGYLNNETMTREKYVLIEGERYYRTGDLAWCLPDGSLAFAGRSDHQTKVRGFRIELGEVEAALATHPGVASAVVVAQESTTLERKLVAYVVPKNDLAPTTTELRSYLQERLPDHMLPSAFVVLEAFPLTPHGKVDRRALPSLEVGRPELTEAYVAPRTPVEEALAEIWAHVLEVDRVGIHDSFFELGGDSILSIRLIARARQKGIEFSARQLFEQPTIVRLAPLVKQRSPKDAQRVPATAAAAQGLPADGSRYTPSDFLDADIKQRELDHLIHKISGNTK